ncbi:MAG: hypothetical protein ACTFAL_05955 [Candidatus Electronema sp. V4]|uniref:hypothetical protein n=1 Tax=Candidatus Electronema sp. V4 TaxID=3454756 RepID=UPI00405578DE
MKDKLTFNLNKHMTEMLLSLARKKKDIVRILMNDIKIMLLDIEVNKEYIDGELTLYVRKMSRLFVCSKNKIISIHFPFSWRKENSRVIFYNNDIDEIDHSIISNIIGLIESNTFEGDCIYSFMENVEEIQRNGLFSWNFVRELFLFEPGYIRYDFDTEHENGKIHPLHHYDLFYSSKATFKIGLKKEVKTSSMINFLDVETDCNFLYS